MRQPQPIQTRSRIKVGIRSLEAQRRVPRWKSDQPLEEGHCQSYTTYPVDLAKKVLQVYWVEAETGEIHNKQQKRSQVLELFAKRALAPRFRSLRAAWPFRTRTGMIQKSGRLTLLAKHLAIARQNIT